MRNKYLFVTIMLLGILVLSGIFTTIYVRNTPDKIQENKLTVVTSFYPMYIAAMNVVDGVEDVELRNLSEPQTGCMHDFQLTPQDMKLLSEAQVFVINGGGIEQFMSDVASAYPKLKVIEACESVELLSDSEDEDAHESEDEHDHTHEDEDAHVHESEDDHTHDETHTHDHDVNAHAWMSVAAYRSQVATIAQHLAKIDPDNASAYLNNAAAYDEKLAKLEQRQKQVSCKDYNVILFHEAYEYVARDYGLNPVFLMDLDEERQVSAGEVADVLTSARENHVQYILAEELYGKSMGDTVERESNLKVLYLDPLNRGEYNKDSYIEGMQKNIDILENAFSGKE